MSYDCAAARELIVSGDNGLLIPTGDDVAFVNASVNLANDALRIQQYSARAVASVAHRSWDSVYDTFIQTLRNVLESYGRQFVPMTSPIGSGLPAQERLPQAHVSSLT